MDTMEPHDAGAPVWCVHFDAATCSLCEICVNHCPPHALAIRRIEDVEEILFDYRLCDGCVGGTSCEVRCPEHAVSVFRGERRAPAEPVPLVGGTMVACLACGARFMPDRKLQRLLTEQRLAPRAVQQYCPACRRARLLDEYLAIRARS